jgi:hypothetical protein
MIAITIHPFFMPRNAVVSKQNKPLKDRQFLSIGDLLEVLSETTLIDRKNGRKYDITGLADKFKIVDQKPACALCALGHPKGTQGHTTADPNQHVVDEGMVVYILPCTGAV